MTQLNPKSMVDSAMNAAIMGAFCVPGTGPFIAAGLAGGQALFDIIFGIVGPVPAQQVMLTPADLQAETQKIEAHVDQAVWQSDYDQHFDFISTLNKGLNIAFDDGPQEMETVLTVGEDPNAVDADWLAALDDFRTYVTSNTSGIYLAASFVENRPSHEVDTIDFYLFTVGCFILACKIALMVEYAKILAANNLQKARSDAAISAAKTAVLAWKYQDPATRGPQPTVPAAFDALLSEAEIKKHSVYVKAYRDRMKGFIDYVQGVIDEIGGAYAAFNAKIAARAAKVTIKVDASGHYYFEDSQTGLKRGFSTSKSLVQSQLDMYLGTLEQPIWQSDMVAKGYDAIPTAKIDSLRDFVAKWTAGRNDAVAFLDKYDPANPTGSPTGN